VTIGLGEGVKHVDSLLIKWPDKGYSVVYNVPVNKKINIIKENSKVFEEAPFKNINYREYFRIEPVTASLFRHKENGLNDFNRDRLLPMMYSVEVPSLLKGDINGDGIEEIYVSGGKDQSGAFIQFKPVKITTFLPRAISHYSLVEETKGTFVDVDNDGDLDFYMASGGRFYPKTSSALSDKLFINDGKGEFYESPHELPFTSFISTSVVKPIDFDNDGDFDLLIGERFDPFIYGRGGRGFLFENNGKGLFTDVTKQYAPALLNIGMITDAEVQDINNDGWKDIILVGDWMPIVVLKNDAGNFSDLSKELGFLETEGWWHDIESGDFNKDGKVDFILGNHGLNTFFKPGDRMYVNDFDRNSSIEQIFCTKVDEKYYPIVDKDEFLSQLPSFKKELLYYKDYGKKSIDELLPKSVLDDARVFQVKLLSSILVLSDPGGYKQIELPLEAQYSPIYSLLVADLDNDGVEDVIAGGNQYQVKPQFGRHDASNAWFFKGVLDGDQFTFQRGIDLNVKGQIRGIEYVNFNGIKYIVFAKHGDNLEIYKISD
jgi:hypothetical protein